MLVSLQAAPRPPGPAVWCLRATWAALGLGILLAAARLYGEVLTEKDKVRQLAKMRRSKPAIGGVSQNAPIVVKLPWYILQAEPACYASFLAAVIALVLAAVLT